MASRSLMLIAPIAATVLAFSSAAGQQAPPECRHLDYRGNFRLNGAKQHIDLATTTKYEDARRANIADASRLLNDVAKSGGADGATLWYMFAQLDLLNKDLVGADSAFTRAEALTDPECKREIERERYNASVPLQNAGTQLGSDNPDSALVAYRKATTIFRGAPTAFLNMALIFYGKAQLGLDSTSIAQEAHARNVPDSVVRLQRATGLDSAIKYFRLAAHSTDDRRYDDARETALFNTARLVQGRAADTAAVHAEAVRRGVTDSVVKESRLKDAEAAYREVLAFRPRDLPAQASLAGVLTALHREAEARTVYDSMLSHADSMDALDLLDAGTALFRVRRFDLAARALEMGLAKDRCDRDGLYNLANVYLASKDTVKMLGAARRLAEIDPNNRTSLQVLARAWQDSGNRDSTLRVLLRADSLPWEMSVIRFEPGDSSASMHGMVTNLRPAELKGFTLTVQFVNAACDVVASQNVELPDLNGNGNAGQSYDFTVQGNGRGILSYKYKTQ